MVPPMKRSAGGLSCGDVDRPRLAINAARFLSPFVQLRPAFAARGV
jgi:hypothetical protein